MINFSKISETLNDQQSKLNIFISLCFLIFMGYMHYKEEKTIDILRNDENNPQNYQTQTSYKKPSHIKTKILFIPCANGYDYGIYNYDFTSLVESELTKSGKIKILSFPFKKLMGINYHDIWNKEHCSRIIEKVNADFLILSRFSQNFNDTPHLKIKWGYEIKIINTKNLKEIHSINVDNLKSYNALEEHIKNNIETLKKDIEFLNRY